MNSNDYSDQDADPFRAESSRRDSPPQQKAPLRPNYMTVGSGSTSESAARLMAMIDQDSGYGGSVADGEGLARGWHPGITEDRPTPSHTPVLPGESSAESENERRVFASHVHQLFYNQNKNALNRAIGQTVEVLKNLQKKNSEWPAHYPSVQRPTDHSSVPHADPRPGLHHTQSTLDNHYGLDQSPTSRPTPPRRAGTTVGAAHSQAESSSAAAQTAIPEPRLITPQLSQEFSVLKIDLKMGNLSQAELVHSLEKHSIAALLDGQIKQSVRHLYSLRERIEDISSKVLVTGDLNAGKSTFCNALLRRKVLPEDQQPCTSIFCEVLDARENDNIEEVHVIPKRVARYNRDDERTFEVHPLSDLEKIVTDSDRYSQCKIYIKDIRGLDESLLNNGVVDIALIDAPGLNADSVLTTAVFARQEEIDVVVFVVSAANHFTQSAKEFIFNAAREKAYIFMVVNGFDNIRDKNRCQEMILKQVAGLSPATFKESSELVHFVSSNAIPVAPAELNRPGGVDGSSSGSGPGFEDPGKGKEKEREKIHAFEELEASLRRFVLEKRSRSKLAPAKTYLMHLLGDLHSLATVNRDVAQAELDRVTKDLSEIEPAYEKSRKVRAEAGEKVDSTVEDTASEVYKFTRDTLNSSIARVAEEDLGVPYPGLFSVYDYAEDIKSAMIEIIAEKVEFCEEHARGRIGDGFSAIKSLGLLHLGDSFAHVSIQPQQIYRRKKDALARYIDLEVETWDFFDVSSLWERQEKVAGTSMALTVAGVVGGRLVGGVGWLDGTLGAVRIVGANNLRRLIIPGLIAGVVLGVSYALSSIPQSLPRRLNAKLSTQLAALDYTHSNALRISSEVRRALKFPGDYLRVGLQRNIEKLQGKKQETSQLKEESEVARKYFSNLIRESERIRTAVTSVDLEGPSPGIAAAYSS
ncbi:hypothetical protein M501DRAFT_936356 [Patellaria atrata CBS 101060]|uniref:Dynamin N-terminal domain-containing protein n=1 Tax=Patellaria atrata CBS 101060 TaxID=1346257 RepID=A0A9P4VQI7_9PEZI|nr:hypothetical protein M501DRAFT_936356 [Patellaria atrata CBS 101060]